MHNAYNNKYAPGAVAFKTLQMIHAPGAAGAGAAAPEA